MDTQTCHCCGGDLPPPDIWEAHREEAGDCDGSVTESGRCRAYADDSLWEPHRRGEVDSEEDDCP